MASPALADVDRRLWLEQRHGGAEEIGRGAARGGAQLRIGQDGRAPVEIGGLGKLEVERSKRKLETGIDGEERDKTVWVWDSRTRVRARRRTRRSYPPDDM
jgi:hypothetical protein